MKKPTRKQIYILAAAAALVLLIYFGMFRQSAVIVETGQVSRGDVASTVDAEGKTQYHDRFVVNAPVSGRMFRVMLHVGDPVPKGYVITRIDPTPPRPTDPNQTPEGTVFPYAYNVYAPTDGKLTRIFLSSEGMVQSGTPIAEISKPSQLEIVADVLSADATQLRPQMPVIVENWGGSEPLQARIRLIEPQAFTKVSALGVEEQRVNVIADFLKPPSGLGDNFRVDVRIVLWEGKDVLRVPANALFRQDEDWCVYVISGSRARLLKVEVGHRSPSFAEVLSGLAEGDTVIMHPPNSVADGTRVKAE